MYVQHQINCTEGLVCTIRNPPSVNSNVEFRRPKNSHNINVKRHILKICKVNKFKQELKKVFIIKFIRYNKAIAAIKTYRWL